MVCSASLFGARGLSSTFHSKEVSGWCNTYFPESEFKSVDLEKLCAASVFVAVDAHGEPYIYLGSLRGMVVEHGIVWRRLKASMWIGECLFRGV